MHSKAIFNIVNFIRGVEPRDPSIDLVRTVREQIRLVQEHTLPATWLLQYDALTDPRFLALMETLDDRQEIGVWFEVVQSQVEKAGLKWRGRPGFSWDWHAHVGFSAGYPPHEREALADVVMEEFHSVFGRYPSTVGSWFMDAHLIGYLHDRYGVIASCNCKDQWGTDGYTMWGGYYSQAYYPSRKNAFMPAQTTEGQIPVPIFRMLGSDPIYQYDASIRGNGQLVVTLEPVYGSAGGSPEWVRWFLDTTIESPALTFGYAQVGQENSFGWPAMEAGLTDQVGYLAEIYRQGRARVETMETSARWYRSMYEVTPASAVPALTDWKDEGRRSVWYGSRFYRLNLYWEDSEFRVRDVRLFDENYAERYLTAVCAAPPAVYDTLPVLDGLLWSDATTSAGMRLLETLPSGETRELPAGTPSVTEDGDRLIVEWESRPGVEVRIVCSPETCGISVSGGIDWDVEARWAESKDVPLKSVEPDGAHYEYEGYQYTVSCLSGEYRPGTDGTSIRVVPGSDGEVRLGFAGRIS